MENLVEHKGSTEWSHLSMDYLSPRWTAEILDCSMPMTMDTYSVCAYNCQYCFSWFQKSHCLDGYLTRDVRCVNPAKVERLFKGALGDPSDLNKNEQQFVPYIHDRKIMQWGGLADEFDEYERRYGLTLELLRFFDHIDYPLSFSTKAVWWTEDARYMDLFAKHKHNWHVKVSIITLDEHKAQVIERGCPSPQDRLKAMANLTRNGNQVTLRLRPYLIGASEDFASLIASAHDSGAKSATTEYFCLESRADQKLRDRYTAMSKVLGYDVHTFYMENSHQQGYKRLSRAIKLPVFTAMRDIAHSYGMKFLCSDADGRDVSDCVNCCGVPDEWACHQKAHFGGAVTIAKEKGEVRWSDIREEVMRLFPFSWLRATGFNTSSNKAAAIFFDTSMAQWIRYIWNNIRDGRSPARGYGRVLTPVSKDENGDVVYKYTGVSDGKKD